MNPDKCSSSNFHAVIPVIARPGGLAVDFYWHGSDGANYGLLRVFFSVLEIVITGQ